VSAGSVWRPNMRVQRTRVLLPAVARRSPLTRRPLDGVGIAGGAWRKSSCESLGL
jgi:hypothetical protein